MPQRQWCSERERGSQGVEGGKLGYALLLIYWRRCCCCFYWYCCCYCCCSCCFSCYCCSYCCCCCCHCALALSAFLALLTRFCHFSCGNMNGALGMHDDHVYVASRQCPTLSPSASPFSFSSFPSTSFLPPFTLPTPCKLSLMCRTFESSHVTLPRRRCLLTYSTSALPPSHPAPGQTMPLANEIT